MSEHLLLPVLPTLKAIVKYLSYPSIAAINEAFPNKYFTFSIIGKKDLIDQIKKLNQKKATQDTDILTKRFFCRIYLYNL